MSAASTQICAQLWPGPPRDLDMICRVHLNIYLAATWLAQMFVCAPGKKCSLLNYESEDHTGHWKCVLLLCGNLPAQRVVRCGWPNAAALEQPHTISGPPRELARRRGGSAAGNHLAGAFAHALARRARPLTFFCAREHRHRPESTASPARAARLGLPPIVGQDQHASGVARWPTSRARSKGLVSRMACCSNRSTAWTRGSLTP